MKAIFKNLKSLRMLLNSYVFSILKGIATVLFLVLTDIQCADRFYIHINGSKTIISKPTKSTKLFVFPHLEPKLPVIQALPLAFTKTSVSSKICSECDGSNIGCLRKTANTSKVDNSASPASDIQDFFPSNL